MNTGDIFLPCMSCKNKSIASVRRSNLVLHTPYIYWQRIQWITSVLHEQLEDRLKTAFETCQLTANSTERPNVSKQCGAKLRQALSTYLVIDRLPDVIDLYRCAVLRPKLAPVSTVTNMQCFCDLTCMRAIARSLKYKYAFKLAACYCVIPYIYGYMGIHTSRRFCFFVSCTHSLTDPSSLGCTYFLSDVTNYLAGEYPCGRLLHILQAIRENLFFTHVIRTSM
ncbi:unnamed protein product [Echinostoma caproni]|uniref:Uncharacterized protein n=1 Tax=Echinostoma caproni TaxID=27848 RepID=A0A183B9T2_9TREM|nr:unnamed protein product [Echinostoma caproni]